MKHSEMKQIIHMYKSLLIWSETDSSSQMASPRQWFYKKGHFHDCDEYYNWSTRHTQKSQGACCWWLVACLTSQQLARVPQGHSCSDNLTCCHTEIGVVDQTFYFTQSQYTDTGPTSPKADPLTRHPAGWPVEYQFLSHWYDSTKQKKIHA